MRLSTETLKAIERRLGLLDEIWEQAEDMGIDEEEGIAASDHARELMIAAISKVDLGEVAV